MNNLHVARKLFDILTDCEIAHQLTGVSHYDYISKRSRREIGQTRRELTRILGLGPDNVPDWMDIFINEFKDCVK